MKAVRFLRRRPVAIKIYIDQGHNPQSPNSGAEGNGFYEQDLTYAIGLLLYDQLMANGNFDVRLSRPTPDTVLGRNNSTSLSERVREANEFGADVFISLHTNAAENRLASGSEALIYSEGSRVSYGLAEDILKNLNLTTGLRNRGIIERPGLYVLRFTGMPAVLVEMGFISNRYDAELMAYSPELFSEGIYRGIVEYYGVS